MSGSGDNVVVIFAGLPDSFESEGYDRTSMELPKCQNRLIEAVAEIQKNVVVVLHNGSPVETPWAESVNAILGDVAGRRRHWGGQRPAVIWGGKSRRTSGGDVPISSGRQPELPEFPWRRQDCSLWRRYLCRIPLL